MALKCLSEYVTLPAGANSQSIVEGHREKTLALLWSIIFHFNVRKIITNANLNLFPLLFPTD